MAKTFYIETHGCQMNVHDSEKIGGLLVHRGMTPVSTVDEADLFILNTCSVREKAAQKVYSRLGQLRPRKKKDPNFLVGVVGCVAQQEREEMVNKVPFVDLVVGTHLYHTIPDLLDERLVQTNSSVKIPHTVMANFLEADEPVEISQVQRNDRVRAAVTIMEGCNKRCAFCIVPQTRGRERNRPARLILDEIRRALDQGYPEIQLLGQTVNSYRDPEKRLYKFADLLAETASLEGLRRLRFTSPHPRHFSDDVISVIAEHETICNHVHLPLQSGSTRILRRMRRQHDREWYENLVEKFRTCGRRIALSTDMIVGFPGESDQDFADTLSLVEYAQFEQMFSFKYSIRPSTEASEWDDDVPEQVKSSRLIQLQRLQREIQLKIHEEIYRNQTFEVLTEGEARDGQRIFGRTVTNKVVNFHGNLCPGEFVPVRITQFGPNSLVGESDLLVGLADAV